MDEQKDNNTKGLIPSVFRKETERTIAERAEKITSAIYMVTGLLSDKEALKWSTRDVAVTVLSYTTMSFTSLNDRQNILNDLSMLLHELFARLRLMQVARLLSEMNCSIIQSEYEKLFLSLDDYFKSEMTYGTLLMKEILNDDQKIKPPVKDIESSTNKGHSHIVQNKTESHKKQQNSKTNADNRKSKILSVVDAKGKVTLGDISSTIASCSPKTLQRDLTDMVEQGVLKKSGERRWTVYYRS